MCIRDRLSGGSLSVHGGIGLSMEKFNKILKIDHDNLQVIVQPGVITQNLQDEVAQKGLYYALQTLQVRGVALLEEILLKIVAVQEQ